MATSKTPLSYGALLFPGFEVLDIAGPLEALNCLSMLDGQENMTLSVIARSMDPLIPAAPDGKGKNLTSKQLYLPTHTFDNAPQIDVLLVPGGHGTVNRADTTAEVDFIKKVYRGDGCQPLQYLFTVCTGSRLAAQAGVLDGHRATTNKQSWKGVTPYGPKTYWVGHARWVVSGNIWTASGMTAGIDAMIAWLEHLFSKDVAEEVINIMEYNRESDPSNDPFGKINNVQDVPPDSQ